MSDGVRVARLVLVAALVGSLWACYTTVSVPGDQAARLRELTTAPEVTLVGMSERVTVKADSELTLTTRRGDTHAVMPATLSYSATALKIGRASDPRAHVLSYDDILRIDVRRLSMGRTLGLTLPLAGVALVVALEAVVFLICNNGQGC